MEAPYPTISQASARPFTLGITCRHSRGEVGIP